MADNFTIGELSRKMLALESAHAAHTKDCAEYRKETATALRTVSDYMLTEQTQRKARQAQFDEQKKAEKDAQSRRDKWMIASLSFSPVAFGAVMWVVEWLKTPAAG